MHDIRAIRSDPDAFDAALARRGHEASAKRLVALDEERRALTTRVQEAQSRRNDASQAIGQAMGQGDTDRAEALKAEVTELKRSMPDLEEREREAASALDEALAAIPNLPAADVPDGADESDNVEVSVWGDKPEFDFEPREHAEIGPALGMDFETGAKLSGARFTFLRGQMARLHRALGQFMLDRQVGRHGYTECAPPLLVRDEAMYGTDKLPKFAEDSFQTFRDMTFLQYAWEKLGPAKLGEDKRKTIQDTMRAQDEWEALPEKKDRLWLIPTAEVSLTASAMGDILDADALPMRLTALTPCFRSEAGSAGRDTRGFIRQHQFEKVELVSIVRPEDSEAEHERMTAAAEDILQALGLPYRRMLLCAGDLGFGARKTYDLEVWLPGQGAYREISSCSNTGDFQARRMNTRYRPDGGKGTHFVHTLNGSGLAVGRTLVALLENFQCEDGGVLIPDILHPYTGGLARLDPA
jgi:seryl-tRNA synthetase